MNSIELSKNLEKLPFTDAYIVNASSQNVSYIIMSNDQVKVFENHKEIWNTKPKYILPDIIIEPMTLSCLWVTIILETQFFWQQLMQIAGK